MANYHVTKRPNGWAAIKEGASKAASVHGTQSEAQQVARELSANSGGGELVTHDEQGQIRQKNTIPPAKDPFPPRG